MTTLSTYPMERRRRSDLCINMVVKYTYQIKSILFNGRKDVLALRVILATDLYFYDVDVPAEVFEYATLVYLGFRMRLCEYMDIRNLPKAVEDKVRKPVERFLDDWILEEQDGYNGRPKDTNS